MLHVDILTPPGPPVRNGSVPHTEEAPMHVLQYIQRTMTTPTLRLQGVYLYYTARQWQCYCPNPRHAQGYVIAAGVARPAQNLADLHGRCSGEGRIRQSAAHVCSTFQEAARTPPGSSISLGAVGEAHGATTPSSRRAASGRRGRRCRPCSLLRPPPPPLHARTRFCQDARALEHSTTIHSAHGKQQPIHSVQRPT